MTAFSLVWRDLLREVMTINSGAARIKKNAMSCIGENASPRKHQPMIRYSTGASWIKMPRLVESSISRALRYGMPATALKTPESSRNPAVL